MFIIPIALVYKAVRETLRLRPIRSCKIYIPAIGKNEEYRVSLEDKDLDVKYIEEKNGDITNIKIGEYFFSIVVNFPEDLTKLSYKELKRQFHIVKLDLVDDDTIAPDIVNGVYLYIKM